MILLCCKQDASSLNEPCIVCLFFQEISLFAFLFAFLIALSYDFFFFSLVVFFDKITFSASLFLECKSSAW